MRVRLREVAELAGVSEATVSRVLNERPNVADRTRSAVIEALRLLDGPLPANLRRGADGSGLVAVLLPEFDNPIFPVMAQLLAGRFGAAGYLTVVARGGPATEELAALDTLASAGIAGVVVVSGAHADSAADMGRYQRYVDSGLPMVFVNGPRRDLAASYVSCDDRHAAILAVQHLVSLGHRQIGFVSGPRRLTVVQRKLDGYRAALAAAGLPGDDSLVIETMFSAEAGHAAVATLAEAGATAAVTASDVLALGTIRGARDLGLDVPGAWSVTGYDDTALMAYTDPPLTTVRQPVGAMCEAAADVVAAKLAGRPPRGGELLFRPELVVRASTGPAANSNV